MNALRGWRWNRFGPESYGLVVGAGVRVMASNRRATSPDQAWRFRRAGARGTRLQMVREADGTEVVGVSVDWNGTGAIDGRPLRWHSVGSGRAELTDGEGLVLRLDRDADPRAGATVLVGDRLPEEDAVELATFAWLATAQEIPGVLSVGGPRAVRRVWS